VIRESGARLTERSKGEVMTRRGSWFPDRQVVITVVTAVVLLAVTAGCTGTPSASVTQPSEWATPAPEIISTTKEYLAGDGADVVTVLDQAVTLAQGGTNPATCAQVVDVLDAMTDQRGFRWAAAGIPDPVLADLAQSTATVVSDTLIACLGEVDDNTANSAIPVDPVSPTDLGKALDQLRRLNELTAQRRQELG